VSLTNTVNLNQQNFAICDTVASLLFWLIYVGMTAVFSETFCYFFADTIWSMKPVICLSFIRTYHTVFISLYFQTFWLKLYNFFLSFQKHFGLWPKNDRKTNRYDKLLRFLFNFYICFQTKKLSCSSWIMSHFCIIMFLGKYFPWSDLYSFQLWLISWHVKWFSEVSKLVQWKYGIYVFWCSPISMYCFNLTQANQQE